MIGWWFDEVCNVFVIILCVLEIDGVICLSDKICKRYMIFEFFLGKKKLYVWVKKKDYWIINLKIILIVNKVFKFCYDVIIYF